MKKFITEFFNRFGLKTPPFFQVIQWLSILTATIAGIPALLSQFQTELGITIPAIITALASKAVAWSAIAAWIIAKLPVKCPDSPAVSQQLPFTETKKN